MCLVLALLMSFLMKAMKDWLSVYMGMGAKLCLRSFLRQISNIPSPEAINPTTSSASIDDWVTSPCFFNAQDTGAPLTMKTHPVVDFQSLMFPAKSASMNPARLCPYPSTCFPSCLYVIP